MERNDLAERLINFSVKNKLFEHSGRMTLEKSRIVEQLEKSEFVEGLIHTLILKTKHKKSVDKHELKKLLLELERIRLDLEYDECAERAAN